MKTLVVFLSMVFVAFMQPAIASTDPATEYSVPVDLDHMNEAALKAEITKILTAQQEYENSLEFSWTENEFEFHSGRRPPRCTPQVFCGDCRKIGSNCGHPGTGWQTCNVVNCNGSTSSFTQSCTARC